MNRTFYGKRFIKKMMYQNLLAEKNDGITMITINRPKALNALNVDTLNELMEALKIAHTDDETKVIIITGSGEKAFVAGADIAFMQPLNAVEGFEFAHLGQEAFMAIERCPKPVIAAINGFALGGGEELCMACDMRIAAENAKFGQPEINLGIIPGFAGTQRLPRLVGKTAAKYIIYTGDMFGAEEAYRLGLVNKVVPLKDLMAEAKSIATKIASKGAVSLKIAKSAIDVGIETDFNTGSIHESELFGLCFATADQKEGMKAFLEKRKAKFVDR